MTKELAWTLCLVVGGTLGVWGMYAGEGLIVLLAFCVVIGGLLATQ